MQQPVIAAVDPLREDTAPAALGLMLARLTRAPLLLAGAYPVDLHVDGVYPDVTRAVREDAEAAMRRFGALVENAPGARVPVATTVVPSAGFPARALHDLAEQEEASLVVLGSSRRGHLGRVLPGAVTDRLLHGAPCPVAVAPVGFSFEDADAGLRLIGVGFTDTPDGHAALGKGCTLAARARGLVRVLTVAERVDPLLAGGLDAGAFEAVRSARDDAAATVLRRGLDAVSVGRSAGGEILTGAPRGGPRRRLGRPRPARLRVARLRTASHAAARRNLARTCAEGGVPRARRAAVLADRRHRLAANRRPRSRELTSPSWR